MNKNLRAFLFLFISLLIGLLFIVTYRAFIVHQPCKHDIKTINDHKRIKLTHKMLQTLQASLQFQTVSFSRGNENLTAKIEFVNFIRKEFADIEQINFVSLTMINNHSMLYKVEGKDTALKPYLIAAHYDVVPAEKEQWNHDPFSGKIIDGFIYGRGTMDYKACMIAQLESIRLFLKNKGQPERTIYLAYGHDEEISGGNGAVYIADHLKNIPLEYVIDEGAMIIEDLFPTINKPTALIGIAEKGSLTVKFSVNITGGHSSMPNNDNSALYILSEAITRLKNNRQPAILRTGSTKIMLEELALHMGIAERILLTNTWLFAPLIEKILSKKPNLDAIQRTTTAVTIFKGGVKENVLPSYGEFIVNHRIHNSQSCNEVEDFDVNTVADSRIKHEVLSCTEPSHVSPMNTFSYELLKHITMEIYPDCIIQPTILPAQTDSRFYGVLTKNIYKYFPIRIKNEDLKRYHGVNERISLENYENVVNFYYLIFKNTEKAHLNIEEPVKSEL